ncbi:MAG: PQQ-binding-like beta-propeller repeat protein, partial [Planctomycetales bacterium]|nr:PQQ-binding-like beta-propeller repeat protein [Planctomycetales bacterium]
APTAARCQADPSSEGRASTIQLVGDYRVVSLTLTPGPPRLLEKGIALRESQPLQLAFRDGKLVNYWLESSGWTFERTREARCELDEASLTGRLRIAVYSRATPAGWVDLSFDLQRTGSEFSGTCQINASFDTVHDTSFPQTKTTVTFPLKVRASGQVLSFDSDAVSTDANWPTLCGPRRTMETEGPELVDDLAEARPVWRSEASIPVSYGCAPDMRYAGNSRASGTGGGSSSPVLVNGVIYQGFYRPHKSATIAIPDWMSGNQWQGKTLDEFTADWHPDEKRDLQDFFRVAADDHLVAIDARTGRTLWETIWPRRSYNFQTHKHRGLFGVPLVAAGKVFYPNLHGHLMVMDATTGQPLWEFPEFKNTPKPHAGGVPATQNPSPFLVGDTLIWNAPDSRLVALSIDDGSIRWTDDLDSPRYSRILGVVGLNDEPAVLTLTGWLGEEVALLNAKTGGTVWRQKEFTVGQQGRHKIGATLNDAMLHGDQLVTMRIVQDANPPAAVALGWRITAKGLKQLWESDPIVLDETPNMAIGGNVLYVAGRQFVRCIDLETGKQIGNLPEAKAGSNPCILIAGNKLIVSPEGQHGSQSFLFYQRMDDGWMQLGQPWSPPNASTTAYNTQPLVHPVIDGRLFVRGGNGIYCYDLRKGTKESN